MPAKSGYYTKHKLPRRKTERRIKLPPIPQRPVRFQLRSLIRQEFISKQPWWFVVHRRGPGGRPHAGVDALEARAVPHGLVRGTLPERILYAALIKLMHFIPDVDFDFQSGLQGGRIGFGGIVVDFLFPHLRLAIQVQGPTHDQFIRIKKDQEQKLALEEMGYTVVEVDEDVIYNEAKLDDWLRVTFGWLPGGQGASPSAQSWEGSMYAPYDISNDPRLEEMEAQISWAGEILHGIT